MLEKHAASMTSSRKRLKICILWYGDWSRSSGNPLARSTETHDHWFSTHTGHERSLDRRRRTSGNEITRSPAAGSGSGQLKYREAGRQVHTDTLLAATQVNKYTKDEKREAGSVPSKTKEHQQARRQQRRKHKAQERRNKRKRKDKSTALHGPPEGKAKAFKEAGLPSKGLWTLSHRNKAKRISQMEAEPDKNKLILFKLR